METTVQPNPNPASQPNGIEVKINPGRISIYVIVFYLLVMFASSVLYIFIWTSSSGKSSPFTTWATTSGSTGEEVSSDCCSSYLPFISWPAVW